ncbi:hypothetical protein CVT26_012329 [Gymnopilus dilepis]|uniref:Uncharacterized protein n=1 Tax=Gymnopilus dilepis TaxID=231916 RepID=A0A409YCA1_9AGAR|nr:hypothetical protein CVT26_012329 [Gymnopilus dilepis]
MSVWLSGNFVSKLSLSCAAPAKSTKKTAQQPALLPVASSHAPADRIVLRKEEEDEDSGEGGVTMMDVDTDDEEEDEEEEDEEEEEEDEDETEDDDELPPNILPIPQVWKRKSVGNDGPAPKVQQIIQAVLAHGVPLILDDGIEDGAPGPEPSRKITYDIVVYSLKELAKQRGRKAEAHFVELESNLTWVDFWGQIKIKVTDILFPRQPVVGDDTFKVTFTIN